MSTQTASVSLNTDYIKSRIGILRIVEAVIGICGIICANEGGFSACDYGGMYTFYNFVVTTTLILAIIIFIVYMLGLDKLCPFVNCPLSVFINDIVFAVLYVVASILVLTTALGGCSHRRVARIFATILKEYTAVAVTFSNMMQNMVVLCTPLFGIGGTVVLGLLAFNGYQTIRGNQSAPKTEPA